MKPRIIVSGRLSPAQLAELDEHFQLIELESPLDLTQPNVREALREAQGIIGSSLLITDELLEASPALKVIATISVGYDHLPVDELTQRGILVCNTPDVLTETTADTGFALIMATARRVVELANWVKANQWQQSLGPALFGSDVHGKTLGMVGFGRIGQAVAKRGALGFGMRILYSNASPKPDLEQALGAQRRELTALLAESDFVCLTVPLTADTEHLIGAAELARMKPSAILVNIARGKVVDEPALIEALQQGVIKAAGLDVFAQEPLAHDSPLLQMTNVVALPHIGSATHETRDAMAQRAVDNIRMALQGQRPISLVNEEVWK
ncbi:2-hydroxyacid dehydrogenase [Vreelandella hamiltonii]|uniref:Bifunctional glyoxylate/hydroxypyruvate reductase B n=1 Tax=Vreelandella hamiltonii TaxID=502829 RepID=A0A8H9I0Y4_9GAMM|nr:D-glycerate dehydrogenase [Halomonas hamiltonii]GGW21503.1 bifunctional glyoxylate/hydroxypyruvate reductase B [Halomonas hamiltonii]